MPYTLAYRSGTDVSVRPLKNRIGENLPSFSRLRTARYGPQPLGSTSETTVTVTINASVCADWPARDPMEEWSGLNLYGFVYNTPPNAVDSIGLCCCCCCVDDVTLEPTSPTATWDTKTGRYAFKFRAKANLSYEPTTTRVDDGQCVFKWTETYRANGVVIWYDPVGLLEGEPVPVDGVGWAPPGFPWFFCMGTQTKTSRYDTPGGPTSRDWWLTITAEITVESGHDSVCQILCKNKKKTVTVNLQLKVAGGAPDKKFEKFTWSVK